MAEFEAQDDLKRESIRDTKRKHREAQWRNGSKKHYKKTKKYKKETVWKDLEFPVPMPQVHANGTTKAQRKVLLNLAIKIFVKEEGWRTEINDLEEGKTGQEMTSLIFDDEKQVKFKTHLKQKKEVLYDKD